jgi:hypothetical protein
MSTIETTTTDNGQALSAADPASAWVAAFAEGWRAPASPGAFVAHFRAILDPGIRLVQPQVAPTVGLEAFEREFVTPLFTLIDGIHGEVSNWAARGDTIYIELTLGGSVGGRRFSARVCDRVRLGADGRAVERESYLDPTPLLGAVARSPRAWPLFLSLRSRRLARLFPQRSTR